MKILVIGSNSFSGAHFIDYVLTHSPARVFGISRSPENDPLFLPYLYQKKRSTKFTFRKMNIRSDILNIIRLCDREKFDVVVNYAAQGEVRHSWQWPDQWFETNCLAVVRLAAQLRKRAYLKRYIAISTPEVYGTTERPVRENSYYSPSTPYAASKLAGDLFLLTLIKRYHFPCIFTRSANVYGRHQQLYRIIPKTIMSLRLGKRLPLHGNGKAIRSFIHIRDVADATWRVIEKGKIGEVYHLSPRNQELSTAAMVKKICRVTGVPFSTSVVMVAENYGQDAMIGIDASKATRELGWRPVVSLEDGIADVVRWIDENWRKIKTMPSFYTHQAE